MTEDNQTPAVFREDVKCSYFSDGRTNSLEYCIADDFTSPDFHEFLAAGHRRMGNIFYRNICLGCASCIPIRIETDRFSPTRGQKRTLRENKDVDIKIYDGTRVTEEKLALYIRYIGSKHARDAADPEENYRTLCHIHYGYAHTLEMNYYIGNKLIGVGIVDEAADSLSSNYFYYDTDYLQRRPGIFSILKEIALARLMGKKYHYLGFYLEETPKMSYKKEFRPNQILRDGEWRDFSV